MIHRERVVLPKHVYPRDPWRLVEQEFYPRFLPITETLFATANGYLGMRGNFEEGEPAFENGTYINGFYESWPIPYGEEAYGFAKTGQTMLDIPDAKIIRLYVDDEPFYLPTANLLRFERVLDMKEGVLVREVLWQTPAGKNVLIQSRRLVSFEHRHLAAISYRVTVVNAAAPVVVSSEIVYRPPRPPRAGDPRTNRGWVDRPLVPEGGDVQDRRLLLRHVARSSGMGLACGADHEVETRCTYTYTAEAGDDEAQLVLSVDAQPGEEIHLLKYVAYHTSRRATTPALRDRTRLTLDRAVRLGFDDAAESQRRFLDRFWNRADVEVVGDPSLQQVVRFNLFHICQATARAEGTGVPAKGLTGNGYEGHYFWDVEIYLLPFLIYTNPRIARNLLKFRHSMLDQARRRARDVNQKGALFPWRTINGEEASSYYAASTAQYHINADVAYALRKYVDATGDEEFLFDEGVEMLVETARLWVDLGFFSPRDRRFEIHCVTGPDEYNTVVDNNAYTNLMARENLRFAVETVTRLRATDDRGYEALVHRTGLEPEEVDGWREAADRMYVPYDEARGIHPQDDRFLEREMWDFENTPPENYPLLLHYHPLVIYRHQVIKQADVVLAMFLLPHEFTEEEKRRNFDYYDPLTTGDSSLSTSVQAIVAARLGYIDKARDYARFAALMDLADIGGNVEYGAHVASMGGTWMAIVYGLGGLHDSGGRIRFLPRLPADVEQLTFHVTVRGRLLRVSVGREKVTYLLREGAGLVVEQDGQEVRLEPGEPRSFARG